MAPSCDPAYTQRMVRLQVLRRELVMHKEHVMLILANDFRRLPVIFDEVLILWRNGLSFNDCDPILAKYTHLQLEEGELIRHM